MKSHRRIWSIALLAGILLLINCSTLPVVDYAIRNSTGHEMNRVSIWIGEDYEFTMGILVPSALSSYGGPVPLSKVNDVKITWVNPDGSTRTGTVKVSRQQLMNPRMLIFDIQKEGVIKLDWNYESTQ
jgi:hypothetical protein